MASLNKTKEIKDETTIKMGKDTCISAVCIARHNSGFDIRGV